MLIEYCIVEENNKHVRNRTEDERVSNAYTISMKVLVLLSTCYFYFVAIFPSQRSDVVTSQEQVAHLLAFCFSSNQ